MNPIWTIEKTGDGSGFYLQVGPAGLPGSHRVDMTREMAAALGCALYEIEKRAAWRALANVRDALGLRQD